MTNEQALQELIQVQEEISNQLDKLDLIVNNFHQDSESANWGHVGSLNHIKSELTDIIRFAERS